MMEKEFEVGVEVTVDRYNPKNNPSKGIVVGYGIMPISGRLTYKININGCIIQTTGISIVESKNYEPADESERHVV
jgi:hypothetical protein